MHVSRLVSLTRRCASCLTEPCLPQLQLDHGSSFLHAVPHLMLQSVQNVCVWGGGGVPRLYFKDFCGLMSSIPSPENCMGLPCRSLWQCLTCGETLSQCSVLRLGRVGQLDETHKSRAKISILILTRHRLLSTQRKSTLGCLMQVKQNRGATAD